MRACTAKSLLAVAIFFLCLSSARADSISFDLTSNNISVPGSVGTVTVNDNAIDQVTVTIMMNAGFSLKLSGGTVAFNGPSGLTAGSATAITAASGANTFSGLSFKQFFSGHNVSQFCTFAFDYANIQGAPSGVVSADSLTFVLTAPGLMANQFTGVAVHFCTASGTDCSPNTGFASNGPITAVPEAGTMSLFGTGPLGLAGLVRRSIRR